MVPPSPPSPPSSRVNRSRWSSSSRPAVLPVLLGGVEHRGRAAGPGLALLPVRADARRGRLISRMPSESVCCSWSVSVVVLLAELDELVAEDHPLLGGRAVGDHDVGHRVAPVERAQHRHHRRDAAAARPGTGSSPAAGSGSTKSPLGTASRMIVPGSRPSTRCADRKPSGIARTVIAMVRPSRFGRRGHRVRAPVELALDLDPDADVLARAGGRSASPSRAGSRSSRRRRSRGSPSRSRPRSSRVVQSGLIRER